MTQPIQKETAAEDTSHPTEENNGLSKTETEIYDRQIRLWGNYRPLMFVNDVNNSHSRLKCSYPLLRCRSPEEDKDC